MIRIESKDNSRYRGLKALRLAREGRAQKQVLLEGFRLCTDALKSGVTVTAALVSDDAGASPAGRDFIGLLPAGIEVFSLPDRLFTGLCATGNPQGVALVCESPLLDRPSVPPSADGLYLVAEEIRDPGNLGNMIRTADAFAFDAIVMTSGTVYPFNDKVLRAAMGSCFHLPLIMMHDLSAVAAWLATGPAAMTLIAADPEDSGDSAHSAIPALSAQSAGHSARAASGPETTWPEDWPVPAALVIGNEAFGLSAEALRLCTRRVAIPMPGLAESLNAASAAAIFCFEMMLARSRKRSAARFTG